jgi:hypothetical protein
MRGEGPRFTIKGWVWLKAETHSSTQMSVKKTSESSRCSYVVLIPPKKTIVFHFYHYNRSLKVSANLL